MAIVRFLEPVARDGVGDCNGKEGRADCNKNDIHHWAIAARMSWTNDASANGMATTKPISHRTRFGELSPGDDRAAGAIGRSIEASPVANHFQRSASDKKRKVCIESSISTYRTGRRIGFLAV